MEAFTGVGLLALAAVLRPIRLPVFVVLAVAYLYFRRRNEPAAGSIAATLPVAATLAWGALPQPPAAAGAAQCTDLLAPPALWRFLEAIAGLVVVAVLAVDRRVAWGDLGLRLGSRRLAAIAGVGLVIVTPAALVIAGLIGGQVLGGSFFGTYALDLSHPRALLPALVFAASNALAEELAYRGAMRVWLLPRFGPIGSNLAQAVVFGLAHSGPDFVGPVAPVAISMLAAGFIGGVIARRTGSLTLPLAIHAAADVPIYFYWACRLV